MITFIFMDSLNEEYIIGLCFGDMCLREDREYLIDRMFNPIKFLLLIK